MTDILMQWSPYLIGVMLLGIALGVIAWRVAWWQGWTNDE